MKTRDEETKLFYMLASACNKETLKMCLMVLYEYRRICSWFAKRKYNKQTLKEPFVKRWLRMCLCAEVIVYKNKCLYNNTNIFMSIDLNKN